MNLASLNDLAETLGVTRDEANAALKRYVHPECVPATATGQLRLFNRDSALLFAFALAARRAGFFPEQVRAMTLDIGRKLGRRGADLVVITDDGACSLCAGTQVECGPWWQAGVKSLRVVNLAPLRDAVDAAIRQTAARYGDVPRKVDGGWLKERHTRENA